MNDVVVMQIRQSNQDLANNNSCFRFEQSAVLGFDI